LGAARSVRAAPTPHNRKAGLPLEGQQLVGKVSQLESRVATLEDEGKIVKGEVKQILTEIRSAILVRDNPFEGDGGLASHTAASTVMASPPPPPAAVSTPPAPQDIAPKPEPAPPAREPAREPVALRPTAPHPMAPPAPQQPQWSLLTIAGLSAWAEDAMSRVGPLRLEILLDLCEAAGHLTPEARIAMARITELDVAEPEHAPSTNDTVVILRQLDALVNDEAHHVSASIRRVI